MPRSLEYLKDPIIRKGLGMDKIPPVLGKMFLALTFLTFIWAPGCATKGQTGAAGGAGVGAMLGQLIGRDTTSTLIGAGIGAGLGYIIGNEMDKSEAKSREAVKAEETRPLGGSTWQVINVVPTPKRKFKSVVCHFKSDGTVGTTRIFDDGQVETATERYRIVGSTLIVNQNDYIVNASFRIEGQQMIIDTGKHSVLLRRVDL